MSDSWKVSLQKFKTQSNIWKNLGTSRLNKEEQFPASPTLISKLNISEETKNLYLQKRQSVLSYKYDTTIHDERLRPYQNEDVSFLMRIKHKGVFNQQRTGKTPTTLVSLKKLNHNKNLIVTTGSNIFAWEQEYKKWHGGDVIIIRGLKKYRLQKYEKFNENTTFIMSYGVLKNDYVEIIFYLKNLDSIVLDEASLLQNFYGKSNKSTSKQTKAIMYLAPFASTRYALTGTPAPNYAYDVFGILHFLYPDIFTSYWKFINYYFGSEQKQINWKGDTIRKENSKFLSPQKEAELTEFLELISIQRKRKDIMPWLLEADIEEIFLPMENKQEKIYKELSKWWEVDNIIAINQLDLMIKQRMLSVCPLLLGFDEVSNKTIWILEFIEDNPKTPLIITSFFTSYLKILHEILSTKKIISKLMIGETSSRERENIKNSFQEGKYDIILGNHDVIQFGMTLDRGEVLIFTDQNLTWETNDQLKDRIVATTEKRLESKEGQRIIKLISSNSVEEYLNSRLLDKSDSNSIVNDYVSTLRRSK